MTNLDTGLMFNLSRDTDMLVYVDNGNKVPMCFANLACLVAKSAGLTELTVEDHTATQRLYEELLGGIILCLIKAGWCNDMQ